ncbi:DUF6286 domain-containing protein [Leifsonia aquatica]|uniref:DUF6286 domain-containing protein n=1 Tax=Leifsonia aquatica TaxID=144185 RepID=UPI00046AD68D|nr:DUF6286 domain-containing protein [Leifsonia aquatica]
MNALGTRIVRRETHSPRSTAAVVVALCVALVVAWAATEGVLSLLGLRPLLLAPRGMLTAVAALPDAPAAALAGTAVVAGLLGVLLFGIAVLPGRRARRPLDAEHTVVVADDTMLASALARTAARTAAVSADAVSVSLGRRSTTVCLVPVSGTRVDRDAVRSAVAAEFADAAPARPVRVAVLVSAAGKVGS